MKAARDYNPQSKNWRIRYIDEKSGLLRVRYYNNASNAEDFARTIRYSPDNTLIDLCYFSLSFCEWRIASKFGVVCSPEGV